MPLLCGGDDAAAATAAAAAQQQRCWPLVAADCCASDVLRLASSSAAIASCLDSTPGFYRALLAARTGWQLQQANAGGSGDDASARQALSAAVALATHAARAPCVPPQPMCTPPWLPGQPGRARGFRAVPDPATSLSPPLQLSAAQLHLLAFGGQLGSHSHTSGVFTSSCSSSMRSHRPCAHQAVVVFNKRTLAELYLPRSINNAAAAASREAWRGILSGADDDHAGGSSSSVPWELWLNEAVTLVTPPPPLPPPTPGQQGGGGGQGGRRRSRATGRLAAEEAAQPSWTAVRDCVLEVIGANAARCRAVYGTRLVAPGTEAAAGVERCLLQLSCLGAPVLDLRRLRFDLHAAATRQQQQQQQQSKLQATSGSTSSSKGGGTPAVAALSAAQAALDSLMLEHQQQQQQQGALTELDDDVKAELLAAVVSQLAPDVEVLALPVLLPGGRAARRMPSAAAGGSKLSAPRLLSLNVPALVAMRRAWQGLPKLRQVLWLVGTPPPLVHPQASACEPPPQQQQQRPGVLTLQELEAQLEQHAKVSCSSSSGAAGAGNGWSDAAWFEQQLNEQDGSSMSATTAAPAAHAACTQQQQQQQQQQEQQLPRVAVSALLEMLHSCMDR